VSSAFLLRATFKAAQRSSHLPPAGPEDEHGQVEKSGVCVSVGVGRRRQLSCMHEQDRTERASAGTVKLALFFGRWL